MNQIVHNIWLDCDPGVDDTFAIMLGIYHPQFKLIGLSSSTGNSHSTNTARNVIKILNRLNRLDIPIIKGSDHPLCLNKYEYAEEYHGKNGLNLDWPLPDNHQSLIQSNDNFVNQIYNNLKRHYDESGNKVSFVITGPSTNLSLAIRVIPEITKYIDRVLIMGGCLSTGNITEYAEYNVYSDPESLNILLQSDLDITIVTLEATHQICLSDQFMSFLQSGSQFKQSIYDLVSHFAQAYQKYEGFEQPPIHDCLTLYFLLKQRMFEGSQKRLRVECGDQKRGQLQETTNQTFNKVLVIDSIKSELKQIFIEEIRQIIDQADLQTQKQTKTK